MADPRAEADREEEIARKRSRAEADREEEIARE